MIALDRYLPVWTFDLPALGLVGRGLVFGGAALVLWPIVQFLLAGTGVVPFTPAHTLVTGGLYRFSRNPMYLGLSLMLLGGALIAGSLGALLPVPLFPWVIRKRFIEGEERFLEAAFGDDYLEYKCRVRRWL